MHRDPIFLRGESLAISVQSSGWEVLPRMSFVSTPRRRIVKKLGIVGTAELLHRSVFHDLDLAGTPGCEPKEPGPDRFDPVMRFAMELSDRYHSPSNRLKVRIH